jgi:hypothetical protein
MLRSCRQTFPSRAAQTLRCRGPTRSNVSITSLATSGRYDVDKQPSTGALILGRTIPLARQFSVSSFTMSSQSNLPASSDELKSTNLFNVKGFVCVATGVHQILGQRI